MGTVGTHAHYMRGTKWYCGYAHGRRCRQMAAGGGNADRASHRRHVARCVLRVARRSCSTLHGRCCALQVARCALHVARYMLHVARHALHGTCCTLHVARFVLRVARCALHGARCLLHGARCCIFHGACSTLHVACCASRVARCCAHSLLISAQRTRQDNVQPCTCRGLCGLCLDGLLTALRHCQDTHTGTHPRLRHAYSTHMRALARSLNHSLFMPRFSCFRGFA
jgi:hypothetical protein